MHAISSKFMPLNSMFITSVYQGKGLTLMPLILRSLIKNKASGGTPLRALCSDLTFPSVAALMRLFLMPWRQSTPSFLVTALTKSWASLRSECTPVCSSLLTRSLMMSHSRALTPLSPKSCHIWKSLCLWPALKASYNCYLVSLWQNCRLKSTCDVFSKYSAKAREYGSSLRQLKRA